MKVLEKKDILYYAEHPNNDLLREVLKMIVDGDAIYVDSKDSLRNNTGRNQKMWKYKVDRSGWRPNPAIARRIKKLDKVNIGTHEGRVKFGYNYLRFVKEGSV